MIETISDRIRKAAKKKGVKLEYIYTSIGMSNAGFYKMLRNQSYKPETIQQIAEMLDVSVEYLLDINVTKSKASNLVFKNNQLINIFRLDFEQYLKEIGITTISHKALIEKMQEYPGLIEKRLREFDIIKVSSKKSKPNQ